MLVGKEESVNKLAPRSLNPLWIPRTRLLLEFAKIFANNEYPPSRESETVESWLGNPVLFQNVLLETNPPPSENIRIAAPASFARLFTNVELLMVDPETPAAQIAPPSIAAVFDSNVEF